MSGAVLVVVPWSGKDIDLLHQQLRCLTAQDIQEPLIIRVAANTDRAVFQREALEQISKTGRTIAVVDASATPGPSFARNSGAATGQTGEVLFCDADDEVAPDWARHMVAALRAGADLVGGRIAYDRLNAVPFALSRARALPVAFHYRSFTPSASLGTRASVFEALGGFDQTLLSGEDIDLCWRAQRAGYRLIFVSDAVVHYRLRQSVRELWRQGVNYGGGDVELFLRHRQNGMRRSLLDSAEDGVRALVLLALAPLGRKHRLKAALKLGTIVGHTQGSVRHRVRFI